MLIILLRLLRLAATRTTGIELVPDEPTRLRYADRHAMPAREYRAGLGVLEEIVVVRDGPRMP